MRLGGTLAIATLCAWFLAGRVSGYDHGAISACLLGLGPLQWAFGLLATLVAFLAVSRQERVILLHLGHRLDRRHTTGAAMATAAVSQTLGFGPFVGAVVRARLLPQMSLKQSFIVSGAITIGFFAGAGLVGLAFLAVTGPWEQAAPAGLVVLAVLGAIMARAFWPGVIWRGLRVPRAAMLLALLFWVAVDLLALSFAFWVLLPVGHGLGWGEVVTSFILALSLGLLSGSPAGTGPFEAILLVQMPQVQPEALLAGLLAFRAVSYLLPALLGGLWALVGRRLLPRPRSVPAGFVPPGQTLFAPYDRAEVQLARQHDLELVRDVQGQLWTTTTLGALRVLIGEPAVLPGKARSLAPVLDFCRFEGREPMAYKIGARRALTARKAGCRVLRIAAEAVIAPQAFTTDGPDRAGLRRKLRHATKAGVTVDEIPAAQLSAPVLAQMAGLAAAWAQSHGGERGLTTGRWGIDYVKGQRIFAAQDAAGRMIAFATFHATAQEWVLDLIRFGPGTPDGTLYLIVHEAILAARAQSLPRFSLAAVPCESFGLQGRLGRWVKPFSQKARGLQQFKSAFAPRWEPRYAAGPNWPALIAALALLGAGIVMAGRKGRNR